MSDRNPDRLLLGEVAAGPPHYPESVGSSVNSRVEQSIELSTRKLQKAIEKIKLTEGCGEKQISHAQKVTQDAFRAEAEDLGLTEVYGYFARAAESMTHTTEKLDDELHPLQEFQCGAVVKSSDRVLTNYVNSPYKEISESRARILLLARGKGTRPGTSYPENMCNVWLLSQKTPFQLQAERVCNVQKLAKEKTGRVGKIAWYIITSAPIVKPASDFLAEHNYFGLEAENVFIFPQGTLPSFTLEGKMILGGEGALSRAPYENRGL